MEPPPSKAALQLRRPARLVRGRHEAGLEAVARQRVGLRARPARQRREGLHEVLVEVAAEVGRVVAVDGGAQAGRQQRGQVVLGQRVEDAQLDVGQRAHGERHALARQALAPAPGSRRSARRGRCARLAARRARFRCRPAALPRRRAPRRAGRARGTARTRGRTFPAGGRARCCPARHR